MTSVDRCSLLLDIIRIQVGHVNIIDHTTQGLCQRDSILSTSKGVRRPCDLTCALLYLHRQCYMHTFMCTVQMICRKGFDHHTTLAGKWIMPSDGFRLIQSESEYMWPVYMANVNHGRYCHHDEQNQSMKVPPMNSGWSANLHQCHWWPSPMDDYQNILSESSCLLRIRSEVIRGPEGTY